MSSNHCNLHSMSLSSRVTADSVQLLATLHLDLSMAQREPSAPCYDSQCQADEPGVLHISCETSGSKLDQLNLKSAPHLQDATQPVTLRGCI